jgi:signal transduction histidine kinase
LGFFANLSIRSKLVVIIVLATLLALAAGLSVAIASGVQQLKADLRNTTDTVARAAGQFSAVSLAFDDRTEAESSLESLRAFESITYACLYDLDRKPFVSFSRAGGGQPPEQPAAYGTELRDGFVHSWVPVIFDGKRYGALYVQASAETLDARIREYVLTVLALGAVFLAASLGIAYFLQSLISRPLLGLAAVAERVSRDNDYSVRVTKPSEDEIGMLYDGFNAMLEQIQYRQSELERSNRDLDQFAYVASHDLKAPLRAISTLAGWLEEDLEERLSIDEREQLALLRGRVKRMDHLVDGILQYSRVSRLELQLETVDVGQLLREVVSDLAPPPGLTLTIEAGMPVLHTRRVRLSQVFSNLINNAVKYHDKRIAGDGWVRVGWAHKGPVYEFWVADNGPGIAPEHHQKIFQIFQTLQPRDKIESTGLGLALVSKLVDEEGGRIWLESAAGAGATFRFTWPARATGSGNGGPGPAAARAEPEAGGGAGGRFRAMSSTSIGRPPPMARAGRDDSEAAVAPETAAS